MIYLVLLLFKKRFNIYSFDYFNKLKYFLTFSHQNNGNIKSAYQNDADLDSVTAAGSMAVSPYTKLVLSYPTMI